MTSPIEAVRVAIAGASSLRGKELRQWLEESDFPVSGIRLLDEEFVAGTLTEAAGEPVVIETVDEDSFQRARFAFFAGSPGFAARHGMKAQSSGAVVIDLSGGLVSEPSARAWIPTLDSVMPSPAGKLSVGVPQSLFLVPSTPADIAISLSAALAPLEPARLAVTFFRPASERGREAVEELEDQVVKLLSFQPIAQKVFDTQAGFNMLSSYGPRSAEKLGDVRASIVSEVRSYLANRVPMPAIALVQVPAFYSYTFTAYAEFSSPPALDDLATRLQEAGLKVTAADDELPTNVNVAGESRPVLGQPERDPSIENAVWFWGAADNMRVPAATAVTIAEKLLAS
ncbi:MAG: Asd/ArgC dimerization domain-containing protein [Candidatus Acidiferrales bacterium]|jgi:aspartate-semialdehyde dehydrogenase